MNKTEFWSNLAINHLPEMRVLHSGKILHRIGDPENFRNVAQHSLIQAAFHNVLGNNDGSTNDEINEQMCTALVHDADKRLSKRPNDFSDADKERFEKRRTALTVNEHFIQAESGWKNHVNMLVYGIKHDYQTQKAWYVDNIAGKSTDPMGQLQEDVVLIDQRIDELKKRNPDEGKNLNPETIATMENALREKFNWQGQYDYWEVERVFMKTIEKEIYSRLKENEVDIKKPEDIPIYIKSKIVNHYNS